MRRIIAAAFVLASVSAFAQSRAASTAPKAATAPAISNPVTVRGKYVTLATGTSAQTAAPGARVSLLVQVTPGPKIHLYAPGQDGYLAIDLSVVQNPAYSAKAAVYPPPTPYTFAPTSETVKVYSESFRIRQDVVLSAGDDLKRRAASGDTLTIVGAFEYQACDDAVCYRPETLPVQWKVRLKAPGR
jgi:hypothetical protein